MTENHSKEWLERKDQRIQSVLEKSGDKKPISYQYRQELARDLKRLELMKKLQKVAACFQERFDNVGLFNYPSISDKDWIQVHASSEQKQIMNQLFSLDPWNQLLKKLNIQANRESFYLEILECYGDTLQNIQKNIITNAAALGQTKLCQKIYDESLIKLDKADPDKESPLLLAVKRKRLGTAEWLLKNGAEIQTEDVNKNPVVRACFDGNIPALVMFKKHGFDFNTTFHYKDKNSLKKEQISPLDIALYSKNNQMTKVLLEMGANPDLATMCPNVSLRQLVQDKEQAEKRIGLENATLLKDYYRQHPKVQKSKTTLLKRLFSKSEKTR